MTQPLNEDERAEALPGLIVSGWEKAEGRDAIVKSFRFKSFIRAFSWMTGVALWAEKLNHHPEWSNIYNRVDVVLITHDCNGLSHLDVQLAKKMDLLAKG